MKHFKILIWISMLAAVCCAAVQIQGTMYTYMQKRSVHLREYRYFKSFNQNHFFNQFILSEVWCDGEPYYRLYAPEEEIEVRIDRNQTKGCVLYLGKSLKFHMDGFINTKANLYLSDLTEDGFAELIYEEPASGADGSVGNCIIIDLQDMKQLQIEEKGEILLQNFKVEKMGNDKNGDIYKVTDSSHHIYMGYLELENPGSLQVSQNGQIPLHVEYNRKENKLKAYCCFSAQGCEEKGILGDVYSYYSFNRITHQFELEKDYTINMWNPLVNE